MRKPSTGTERSKTACGIGHFIIPVSAILIASLFLGALFSPTDPSSVFVLASVFAVLSITSYFAGFRLGRASCSAKSSS